MKTKSVTTKRIPCLTGLLIHIDTINEMSINANDFFLIQCPETTKFIFMFFYNDKCFNALKNMQLLSSSYFSGCMHKNIYAKYVWYNKYSRFLLKYKKLKLKDYGLRQTCENKEC